jgi:hypothetical protein
MVLDASGSHIEHVFQVCHAINTKSIHVHQVFRKMKAIQTGVSFLIDSVLLLRLMKLTT